MPPKKQTNLFAIVGEGGPLLRERYDALLADLSQEDSREFDLSEYDASEASVAQIVSSLTTLPFLASSRITVVRRAERLDAEPIESITELLERLPNSSVGVFVFESTDQQSEAHKKFLAAVKKLGTVYECVPPKQAEMALNLEARAKAAGYKFESGASKALALRVEGSFADAVMELEKLFAHCAETKLITTAAVNFVVSPSSSWRVFELLDSVAAGNLGVSLTNWRLLASAEGKIEGAALGTLLPQLSRQLRLLYQARACRDAGINLNSAAAQEIMPDKHNLAAFQAKNEWAAGKTIRLAQKLSLANISAMLQILVDCEKRLKGLLPCETANEAVERMLGEMCHAAAPSLAS